MEFIILLTVILSVLLTVLIIIFYKLYEQDRKIKILFTDLEVLGEGFLKIEEARLLFDDDLIKGIKIMQSHVNTLMGKDSGWKV